MGFGRVIWIVLDSVGIGEMPDAAAYGDAGSDTLGNIARLRGLKLPNLARLGLGNIKPLAGSEARRRLWPLHAGLSRQRHHHWTLGNGRHPPGETVPDLSARLPAGDHA